MSPWDRCITRGIPGAFFPAGYNNAYQIVQSHGYVVIHYEMIHAARIIPTDGRPHLPVNCASGTAIRWATGKATRSSSTSRTTTARDGSRPTRAAGRIKGIPQSDALHVVERFTPYERGHDRLPGDDRRSEGLHPAVDRCDSARSRREYQIFEVRLP